MTYPAAMKFEGTLRYCDEDLLLAQSINLIAVEGIDADKSKEPRPSQLPQPRKYASFACLQHLYIGINFSQCYRVFLYCSSGLSDVYAALRNVYLGLINTHVCLMRFFANNFGLLVQHESIATNTDSDDCS